MSECIDVHTHIVPERFPPYAGKGRDVPWPSMAAAHACHRHVMISGQVYRTVSEGCWSVPRRVADMNGMRVACQALSPMPELLSYWLPLDDARALLRYLNDTIAGMVAAAPERFVGLGAVPLQDVEAAVRELEYVRRELGFAGVEIASHVNGTSIGDPRFEPFFAAAEALGAAVFVHALRPAGQERIVGAFPEQAVCFPGDIGLACASMITGGIGARHPRLRIAFSHGGGVMALLLPRLMHAWNAVPQAKASLAEAPAATARRFYYDHLVFDPAAVRFVVAAFGASQVMAGSDYPFNMGDPDPVGTLEAAGFDATTHAAVSAGNARRFLGLPPAAGAKSR
ncbi:MAG TPA: amidohydrolase family protein [Burkholderiales bacterium]|nr:amidohydrolase family protein [Burkholderiales bacterium]